MPKSTQLAFDHAVEAVPTERFHGRDGQAVRPCTPAVVTHRHLRMLDVRTGFNVMDIGIGSGLSSALLAQLVGAEGYVTAVEIDPHVARRAESLYAEYGYPVTVIVGDGLFGHALAAPYDRILVGATPPAIPDVWLQQLKPGGVLLCGVRVSDLPGAYAIARITVDDKHQPHTVEIHHGGYTPTMAAHTRAAPRRAVDPQQSERSLTVLGEHEPSHVTSLLTALTEAPHIEPSPAPNTDYFHLKNWLIATAPNGLIEATLDQGPAIGIGSLAQDGTAQAAVVTEDHLISDHPDSVSRRDLNSVINDWLEVGAPRTEELRACLVSEGDVWHAHIATGA